MDLKYSRNSPVGQGFGHTLVFYRKRVFNVVDPDATANNAALLKEMNAQFLKLWNSNREKIIRRVRLAFDEQNKAITSKKEISDLSHTLLPQVEADYDKLVKKYRAPKDDDFAFAFHACPDNSVRHLHMYVFSRDESLR